MAEITLVRQQDAPVSDADKDAARRVLFGVIDGLGDKGRRQWRRFVNGLFNLAPGEMAEIRTHRERLGWYHRKHMAMETKVFEAQERFSNFKQFRNWLKIGAGHCDWFPGPTGGVVPVPRSIEYAQLEQDEMEEFHKNAVEFLRTPHAVKTLWPKAPEHQRELAVEEVLTAFNE